MMQSEIKQRGIGIPKGTNIIQDDEGRTYHVGIKKEEISNQIILVGELSRAERLVKLLEPESVRQVGRTHRGFYTFTGTYKQEKITIMEIGMGLAMMDFAVREIAQVTMGDLKIVRLGSCGSINPNIPIGTVAVAENSVLVQTDYESFHKEKQKAQNYRIHKRVLSSSHSLLKKATSRLEALHIPYFCGVDITCDSFYASQGRVDKQFEDHNESLIESLQKKFPNSSSMQMETYQLYHLADILSGRKINACAVAIVVAQRNSTEFLSPQKRYEIEDKLGKVVLDCLVKN